MAGRAVTEGCDMLLCGSGSSYLGLTGREEGLLGQCRNARSQSQRQYNKNLPVKICPGLHGEAQEATAFPSSNNLHVAAPRYLPGAEDQWLNAGVKLMGLVWEFEHHKYADVRCLERVICLTSVPFFWITLSAIFEGRPSGFWKTAYRSSAWRQDAADQLPPTRQWLKRLLNFCRQCGAACFDRYHGGPAPYPYLSTALSLYFL